MDAKLKRPVVKNKEVEVERSFPFRRNEEFQQDTEEVASKSKSLLEMGKAFYHKVGTANDQLRAIAKKQLLY